MARYLAWPMRIGPDGRYRVATSPEEVWSNRMAQLLCARMGERVMREDYGTTVPYDLFHNNLSSPDEAVRTAVTRWLPHIRVDRVQVTKDADTWEVKVFYVTPENKYLTTSVNLAVPNE